MEYLVGRGEEPMESTTLDCNIMNQKNAVPGWARRGDHGVNNTSDNGRLAQHVALLDDMLLHQGHLLRQHIQPQVAPAQHDGICLLSNGLEVEQRLPRLTLGNQLHDKQIVEIVKVMCTGCGSASCKMVLNCEFQMGLSNLLPPPQPPLHPQALLFYGSLHSTWSPQVDLGMQCACLV